MLRKTNQEKDGEIGQRLAKMKSDVQETINKRIDEVLNAIQPSLERLAKSKQFKGKLLEITGLSQAGPRITKNMPTYTKVAGRTSTTGVPVTHRYNPRALTELQFVNSVKVLAVTSSSKDKKEDDTHNIIGGDAASSKIEVQDTRPYPKEKV